jgi:hypothetical protein
MKPIIEMGDDVIKKHNTRIKLFLTILRLTIKKTISNSIKKIDIINAQIAKP